MSETPIPAKQPEARQETRVSAPDADPGRASHPQSSPAQGSQAPVGLIWRVRSRAAFREFNPPRGTPPSQRPARAQVAPVTVSFLPGVDGEPPRVAYAIGRKVGNAVTRNRIRRQLRAIVQ